MPTIQATARKLAAALLAGTWEVEDLAERGTRLLGKQPRWLRPLARRIAATYGGRPRPSAAALGNFIAQYRSFQRAWQKNDGQGIELPAHHLHRAVMSPCPGRPSTWGVAELATPGELAQWLGIPLNQLDWFADCQGRERHLPAGPLRHYRYRWARKRAGGVRLIEVPKTRLRTIQRRILDGVLEPIPPHDAAHGFRRGRSIKTFAAPHVGRQVVLRVDLQDFFTSIAAARVVAVFLTAGYPEAVARLLAGLCTNSVPEDACDDEVYQLYADQEHGTGHEARSRQDIWRWPHLPQGAPTSPALANLCAYRLDCRLRALAHSMHAQYTRYADDLVFSGCGELARAARRFQIRVAAIALEEGFHVHPRKSRVMRQSVRQQVAGVVVNARPNIRRADYDRLKALLHNCILHGPASQNRGALVDFRGHLAGRIAHVGMLHPARGMRLRAAFEQIAW
jgi:hypothetical protein